MRIYLWILLGLAVYAWSLPVSIHAQVKKQEPIKAKLGEVENFFIGTPVLEYPDFTVEFIELQKPPQFNNYYYVFQLTSAGKTWTLKAQGEGDLDPVPFEIGDQLYLLKVQPVPILDERARDWRPNTNLVIETMPFNILKTARTIRRKFKTSLYFKGFEPDAAFKFEEDRIPKREVLFFCNQDGLYEEGSYFRRGGQKGVRTFRYVPKGNDLYLCIDVHPLVGQAEGSNPVKAELVLPDMTSVVITLIGAQDKDFQTIEKDIRNIVAEQVRAMNKAR